MPDNCESYKVLRVLRAMAWERAKAELESILETYWDDESEYESAESLISKFVQEGEDNIGF